MILIYSVLAAVYVSSIAGALVFLNELVNRKVSLWAKQKGLERSDYLMSLTPIANTIMTVQCMRGQFGESINRDDRLQDEEEDDYYKVRE